MSEVAAVDVIIAGLGAHGSSAAYHLASRGASVLGFDRFARGHTLGSSGGLSRIIRLSYYEHPDYVPLLRRAWTLWRELERASGEKLLTETGGFYAGAPDGELVAGALESARRHDLEHEVLDAAVLRRRYPLFEWPDGWQGVFARLPIYIVQDTDRIFYGFPYIEGQGVKVAGLHFGDKADPDTVDRTVSAGDEERVRAWVRRRMPLANGERRDAKVCMYTNTPDAHFIVDHLPDHSNVVVASACSGHGFKFSSVIGEILADLVLTGATRHPIGFLSAKRLVHG